MANGLVTAAQFPGLVPNVGQAISQGLQAAQGLQQLQLGSQQMAASKAAEERAQQASGIQSKILQGLDRSDETLGQLATLDPAAFEETMNSIGLIDQSRRVEAADFAFDLQRTPFEQRLPKIRQRVQTLINQGRDPSDTIELSTMAPDQQEVALKAVQLGALTPQQRLEFQQKQEEFQIEQSASAAKDLLKVNEAALEQNLEEQKTAFNRAKDLRGELSKVSSEFRKTESAFERIKASSSATAAGDLALIFNYMKMLDPGSTVREGEFANAQNAGGVPTRIQSTYNNIIEGTRLTPGQRRDFLSRAEELFDSAKSLNDKAEDKIISIGKKFGVSKDLILGDEPAAEGGVINFEDLP